MSQDDTLRALARLPVVDIGEYRRLYEQAVNDRVTARMAEDSLWVDARSE